MPNAPVPGEAQEESDDDEDYKRYRLRKKEQRDLERLLLKADKNDISEFAEDFLIAIRIYTIDDQYYKQLYLIKNLCFSLFCRPV